MRASVDVDFSIEGDFDQVDELRLRVSSVLRSTFAEAGYVAFDIKLDEVPHRLSDDMKDFWGGYRVEFKIIDRDRYRALENDIDSLRRNAAVVGQRDKRRFRIDISKYEYCSPKQTDELDGYLIYVYSPEMMVIEKLRAICQQMPEYTAMVKSHASARARDFVDIQLLCDQFAIDLASPENRRLVETIFATKRVPLRLIGTIKDYREYHRPDFAAVQDTMKPGADLRDFDSYFDYVIAKCAELESLWNV